MKMLIVNTKTSFFRKKLENSIDTIRKNKTLEKIILFIFNLRIRRPMIKHISKNLNNNLIGIEIGTYNGENAKNMLLHLPIKHLYLIDPYLQYQEYKHISMDKIPSSFNVAQKNLSKFSNKITFIKKMSNNAINDIPKEIDFCYIDGNHTYEYVKKDIKLYYPKIKKGGIIGGHDIWNADVYRAVMEFAKKNNLKIFKKYPDWWIIK